MYAEESGSQIPVHEFAIEDLKKSLISPDEDFVRTVDPETSAATRTISRDDMEKIKKQSKKPSHTEEIRLKKNTAKLPRSIQKR